MSPNMGGATLHTWSATPRTKFSIVPSLVLMYNGIPTKILSQNTQKLTANLESTSPSPLCVHSQASIDIFLVTPKDK